jgi:hypothetical protein
MPINGYVQQKSVKLLLDFEKFYRRRLVLRGVMIRGISPLSGFEMKREVGFGL